MKAIYKTNLHNLYVKNFSFNDSLVSSIPFESAVIKEDILFYTGLFGAFISLDHNTRLPDRTEAESYIEQSIRFSHNPEKETFGCSYADYDHMEMCGLVTNKELREMKKAAKQKQKRR